MNPSASSSDEVSREETAALWAARLEGGAFSARDRADLDAWLAADPRHRDLLSEYCQLSADLEPPLARLAEAGAVTLPPPSRRPSRSLLGAWLGAGALAAAAAVALVVTWSPGSTSLSPRSIATPVAQRQAVTLDDGTTVELNAHTTLVIENSTGERRVRLAGGQAFFQVTKDPARPFIVETPSGAVRVTGTAFDVLALSPDQLEVTVLEGSVQVRLGENNTRPATAPHALTAGDQLQAGLAVNADPVLRHLSPEDVANALAWRDGLIVVDAVPLGTVLRRFAHYHGCGLSASAGISDLAVTGRFALDDLDGFLANLEAILPVHVSQDPSGTTRVLPRS